MAARPPQPALVRVLGVSDLVLFNVAAVVGIRWLAAAAHVGPGSIALWLAAAVCFFVPCGIAVGALSRRFPEEGGLYIWTRTAFGEWHGFLCAWCFWTSTAIALPLTEAVAPRAQLGIRSRSSSSAGDSGSIESLTSPDQG